MDNYDPGAPFQKQIEPLMIKYKVDLSLCGHMHMYERTYPLMQLFMSTKRLVRSEALGKMQVNETHLRYSFVRL